MFVCLKLCPVDYVRRVFCFLLVMSLQDTFAILSYVAALVPQHDVPFFSHGPVISLNYTITADNFCYACATACHCNECTCVIVAQVPVRHIKMQWAQSDRGSWERECCFGTGMEKTSYRVHAGPSDTQLLPMLEHQHCLFKGWWHQITPTVLCRATLYHCIRMLWWSYTKDDDVYEYVLKMQNGSSTRTKICAAIGPETVSTLQADDFGTLLITVTTSVLLRMDCQWCLDSAL